MNFKLYCDGACSGNPGPAGIGFVLLWKGGKCGQGHYIGNATNNIAEFKSILFGINLIHNKNKCEIDIITDSQLAIGILSQNWKATANLDLVEELKTELRKFKKVTFIKVKGHSGDPANEFCNTLAQVASKSGKSEFHGTTPPFIQ